MKILITGASGMLGTDLTAELKPHFQVSGAGLLTSAQPDYFQTDLSLRSNVAALFAQKKPDLIFHTAAMTDVDGCESRRKEALTANLEMTRHLVDEANARQARLIFFSTDYIFDGTKEGEYLESDSPCPINFYGETKLLAEKYIQQAAAKYVIFRITWLYGLHGKSFPRTLLERAKNQKKFEIVADQIGRPTYTRDVARAFSGLLSKDPLIFETKGNRVYHLANSGKTSWAEFAEFIFLQAGHTDTEVVRMDSSRLTRPARRPLNSVLSLEKAKNTFGISLRPWQDAVQEFILEFQKGS